METTPANAAVQEFKEGLAAIADEMVAARPELAAFDLDNFDVLEKANEGVIVEMKSADDKPTGLFLKLLGRDSDAFREIQFKHQTRRMKAMNAAGGKYEFDAERAEDEGLELLAACVVSWSAGETPWLGYVLRGGLRVGCTKDEVIKLFRKYPPFKEQADVFIGNRANFLKG